MDITDYIIKRNKLITSEMALQEPYRERNISMVNERYFDGKKKCIIGAFLYILYDI
jgi:hypothetical protein